MKLSVQTSPYLPYVQFKYLTSEMGVSDASNKQVSSHNVLVQASPSDCDGNQACHKSSQTNTDDRLVSTFKAFKRLFEFCFKK